MSSNHTDEHREIAHFIFSGSTTMIGVCITIITLFKVMKAGLNTYADELFGIDTFFFIFAAFFSYLTLRNNKRRYLEKFADILFFGAMIVLIIGGIMIVFSSY